MTSFTEWLKKRELNEGSMGLKRRQRVAAGMAKRQEKIDRLFPNTSDSRRHALTDRLAADVEDYAGRADLADLRHQQRATTRLGRMTTPVHAGGLPYDQKMIKRVQDNQTDSKDAMRSLTNFNNQDVLDQRGKDPNWAAHGNTSWHPAQSDIGKASAELANKKREQELRRMQREKEEGGSSPALRRLDAKLGKESRKDHETRLQAAKHEKLPDLFSPATSTWDKSDKYRLGFLRPGEKDSRTGVDHIK